MLDKGQWRQREGNKRLLHFQKKSYVFLKRRILNFKSVNFTDKKTEKYGFIFREINVIKESLLMATSVK